MAWNDEFYLPLGQCNCILLVHITTELIERQTPNQYSLNEDPRLFDIAFGRTD